MKQFHTVVLDRFADFTGNFATEPYESGWADEAIAFIRVHQLDKGAIINTSVQISLDGIVWLDEGTCFASIDAVGDHFVKVSHFGGWLRLNSTITSGCRCNLTISLVLKG